MAETENKSDDYQIIVTYAVLFKGHDGYCSGNDEVDWVESSIRHYRHDHKYKNDHDYEEASKFPGDELKISEFEAKEKPSIDADLIPLYRELELWDDTYKLRKTHYSKYNIPDGYVYAGRMTNRKRLYNLHYKYDTVDDEHEVRCHGGSGSLYCEGGQGVYHVPLHAILLVRSGGCTKRAK